MKFEHVDTLQESLRDIECLEKLGRGLVAADVILSFQLEQ